MPIYSEPDNTTSMKRSPCGGIVRSQLGSCHRPRLTFSIIAHDCLDGSIRWRWTGRGAVTGIGFNDDYFVVMSTSYLWDGEEGDYDAENLKTTFTEYESGWTANSVTCTVLDSRGMPTKQFLFSPYSSDALGVAFSGDNIYAVRDETPRGSHTYIYNAVTYDVNGELQGSSVFYSSVEKPHGLPFVNQLPDGSFSACAGNKAVSSAGSELVAGFAYMAIPDGESTVVIGQDPNESQNLYLIRTGGSYVYLSHESTQNNAENRKIRIYGNELFCQLGVYNKNTFEYIRAIPEGEMICYDMDASGNIYTLYGGIFVAGGGLKKYDKDFNLIWNSGGWDWLGTSFVATNGDVVVSGF